MKIYNLEGGAEYLMVSIDTIRDLVASGEVDGAKIGKAWVLTEAHLDEFLLKEIKTQTAARRKELAKEEQSPELVRPQKFRRQPARPPSLGVSPC